MYTTSLRKVGGSIMLTVPRAILELLNLQAGATVSVAIEDGRLVVEPRARARYTMAELLAESDYALPLSAEERAWIDAPAIGDELL